ncbi:hypothetical protein L0U85_18365 [Glycomyces sp. L485]|uniref:hypothetical protein n=1 Tax=Glycomyces sp. L485 TaxID=2909235 RepID=UPI001F4A7FE7|nr:hypothetical protein [Glycomyces sp. L485]MCH7232801.1 hypothetical protein [Glycomyces sp. L485]
MPDQYRVSDAKNSEPEPRERANGTDMLLWIILIAGAGMDGILSLLGLELLSVPFGAVAAFAGISLVIRFFMRRS